MTPKQQIFVREYLIDMNAAAAYRRAGYRARGNSAEASASQLLRNPKVAAEIAEAVAARVRRLQVRADDVVRELQAIALADPRELTEYRRLCCRYCHGAGFRYQRTAGEMERDREAYEQAKAVSGKRPKPFDEKGGTGFHAKRDPHKGCPECFGDGVGTVFIHDTRKLSASAAKLFAGVKRTKDGIEVMTRNADGALVNLGRHLGIFKDRLEVKNTDRVAALARARQRVAEGQKPKKT